VKTIYLPLLILAALMCCQAASAQRRLVVVDYETGVPVGGANVVGNGLTTQADTLGYVTVPDSCRSLIFSHVNYESRLINLSEVHDTIFLLSKLLNIKEVVIFGKAPEVEDYAEFNQRFQLPKSELQLAGAQPNGNLFGLLGYLIPKKWKKSPKKKRKERLQEILNDY
jgi:hypothetical protein